MISCGSVDVYLLHNHTDLLYFHEYFHLLQCVIILSYKKFYFAFLPDMWENASAKCTYFVYKAAET